MNNFKNINVKNKINIINVDLKNPKNHKKKLLQSNIYINKCFEIAFNIFKELFIVLSPATIYVIKAGLFSFLHFSKARVIFDFILYMHLIFA